MRIRNKRVGWAVGFTWEDRISYRIEDGRVDLRLHIDLVCFLNSLMLAGELR